MSIDLFFDCETTGIAPKKIHPSNFRAYDNSRMVSICWCLRDKDHVYSQNYCIVQNEITEGKIGAEFIHGITREMVDKYGKPLKSILELFVQDLNICGKLIAHNIDFDASILSSELFRLGFNGDGEQVMLQDKFCTMKKSTDIVKLPSKFGTSFKWPKLSELHNFLFGCGFSGEHCAMEDVNALVRCYYKLQERSLKTKTIR